MHKTPEITRLINENFWTILAFAFGRPAVVKIIRDRFSGGWKYLNKTVNELAEIQADRALLEMATQLRVLDDAEGLSKYYKETGDDLTLGEVTQSDNKKEPLYFRDMTNKIMHAASFRWELLMEGGPIIICLPHDDARWKKPELTSLP
jgi:hypothetical protein